MDKFQEAKSKMYLKVVHVGDNHPDAVNSLSYVATCFAKHKTSAEAIRDAEILERDATVDTTLARLALLDKVAKKVNIERNAVLLYLIENPNSVLKGKMPKTWSDLIAGGIVEQVRRLSLVHTEVKLLGKDLVPFGASEELQAEVDLLLPQLKDGITDTSEAIDARILSNLDFGKSFKSADNYLKTTLDLAVLTRQELFPEFVAAYFKARKLQVTAARKKLTDEEKLKRKQAREEKKALLAKAKAEAEAAAQQETPETQDTVTPTPDSAPTDPPPLNETSEPEETA